MYLRATFLVETKLHHKGHEGSTKVHKGGTPPIREPWLRRRSGSQKNIPSSAGLHHNCALPEQPVDLEPTDTTQTIPDAARLPVNAVWRTIRGYFWWTYDRGSLHYDVMVTLILLFVFLSPYWINYKDKPIERNPHQTGVSVLPDAHGGFLYQIEGGAVTAREDADIRDQLRAIIEPIAGSAVTISKYEAVRDDKGRILNYRVWVQRSM